MLISRYELISYMESYATANRAASEAYNRAESDRQWCISEAAEISALPESYDPHILKSRIERYNTVKAREIAYRDMARKAASEAAEYREIIESV
jgi:hypothetical protein